MFRYQISPVDRFEGCKTLAQYIADCAESENECKGMYEDASLSRVLDDLISETVMVYRDGYWEGDIIDHIYVLPLPPADLSDGCMDIGFIWQQRNNGTTFVLSPRELPWLEENMIFPRQRVHIQHKGATITVSGDDAAFMAERINQMLTGKKP